jgi:hypothetical protein
MYGTVLTECKQVSEKAKLECNRKLIFKNRLPVARGGLGWRCPMRTGRLAGVATNKTVCSRRIRRHFLVTRFTVRPFSAMIHQVFFLEK